MLKVFIFSLSYIIDIFSLSNEKFRKFAGSAACLITLNENLNAFVSGIFITISGESASLTYLRNIDLLPGASPLDKIFSPVHCV